MSIEPPHEKTLSFIKKYWRYVLAISVLLASFSTGLLIGVGVGSDRAPILLTNHDGWMLQSVMDGGHLTSLTGHPGAFLWWNIAKAPHTTASYFLIAPTPHRAAESILAHLLVTAISDGQGDISLTIGSGIETVTGTLHGTMMQIIIPPGSALYPDASETFRTLVFAPSTIDSFNQLVGP